MSRLEMKTCAFEIKSVEDASDGDGSVFTGVAAVFNSIDEGFDLIDSHAYDRSIDEFRRNGKIRDEHEVTTGKIIDAKISGKGLEIVGKISNTSHGQNQKILLRDGVINRLSIGQYVTKRAWLESPEEVKAVWEAAGYAPSDDDLMKSGAGVRHIMAAQPIEASTTFNPMNRRAEITSVKADGPGHAPGLSFQEHSHLALAVLDEFTDRAEALTAKRADDGRTLGPERLAEFQRLSNRLLQLLEAGRPLDAKGAVPYAAAPVVDKAWDGGAARKRLKAWAGDDMAKYRKGFGWFDAAKADDLGSYLFPHHDMDGGKFVTVKKGVEAAMAALNGARGGASIPEADKAKVRAHLAKHYAQWGGEVPGEKAMSNPQTNQDGVLDVDVNIERGNPNASDLVDSQPAPTGTGKPAKGDGVGDPQQPDDDVLDADVVPGERDNPNASTVVDSEPAPKPNATATNTGGSGNAGGAGAMDAAGPQAGTERGARMAGMSLPAAAAPGVATASAPAPEAKAKVMRDQELAQLTIELLRRQAEFEAEVFERSI